MSGGPISIETFDPEGSERNVILDSPTSIEVYINLHHELIAIFIFIFWYLYLYLQACEQLGIEQEELLRRSISYFQKKYPNEDMSFIQKKAERYESNRVEIVKKIRSKRHQLLDKQKIGSRAMLYQSTSPPSSPLRPRLTDSISKSSSHITRGFINSNNKFQCGIDSTMIDIEMKRLEKIQQRQVADVQLTINLELKRAELQQRHAEAEALRKKHEVDIEREKLKRNQEAEEARRRREHEKSIREHLELQAQKQLAQKEYLEIQKRKDEDAQKLIMRKKEAMLREKERRRKHEHHKKQTESILQSLEEQVTNITLNYCTVCLQSNKFCSETSV